MQENMDVDIIWHQLDLSLEWNFALASACKENQKTVPVFIYDEICAKLGGASKWWLREPRP